MTAPNIMTTSSDIKALAGNQAGNIVGDLNVEGTFTVNGAPVSSSPAGGTGAVQYNSAGAFAGDEAYFSYGPAAGLTASMPPVAGVGVSANGGQLAAYPAQDDRTGGVMALQSGSVSEAVSYSVGGSFSMTPATLTALGSAGGGTISMNSGNASIDGEPLARGLELRLIGAQSQTGLQFPGKFEINVGSNVNKLSISEGGVGFFGSAVTPQPAAIADATNAGEAITQLNLALAALRALGLIDT